MAIAITEPPPAGYALPTEVPERLRQLSREQYRQWLEEGYVVVPQVVDRSVVDEFVAEIWRFTGRDPEDRSTWFDEFHEPMGMLELYASVGQWKVRTAPRFHAAFADLWDREDLRCSLNRVSMNLPMNEDFQREDVLHWDLGCMAEPGFNPAIQCVLALSDADDGAGTFCCVPGSHQPIYDWHARGRVGEIPTKEQCMAGREAIGVPLRAGDIVCWNMALLHGNQANRSDQPRIAAYVHLEPAGTIRTNGLGLEREALAYRMDVIDVWRDTGWQQALAQSVGCSEAAILKWVRECLPRGRGQPLPPATRASRVSDAQRAAVDAMLDRVPMPEPRDDLGDGHGRNRNVRQELEFCRLVCQTIQLVTGVVIDPVPPCELDGLGRKLLGLQPW